MVRAWKGREKTNLLIKVEAVREYGPMLIELLSLYMCFSDQTWNYETTNWTAVLLSFGIFFSLLHFLSKCEEFTYEKTRTMGNIYVFTDLNFLGLSLGHNCCFTVDDDYNRMI